MTHTNLIDDKAMNMCQFLCIAKGNAGNCEIVHLSSNCSFLGMDCNMGKNRFNVITPSENVFFDESIEICLPLVPLKMKGKKSRNAPIYWDRQVEILLQPNIRELNSAADAFVHVCVPV